MRRISVALLLATVITAPALAQRLPTTVVPDHYDLTFKVDLPNERFTGLETIRVRVIRPTSRVVLNALDLRFDDVTIDTAAASQEAAVSINQHDETATLTIAQPLPAGPAEIRIRYAGVLNQQLRGFYLGKTARRKYAVTQFESTDARRAFPCFDEPALKATFALTLVIDRRDTAISNGKVLSDMPGPGRTQHTVKFATSPKMSSYLVAMAVGGFRCLDGSQDGVPIRVCAMPDKTDLGQIALESTKQILKFYNGYYAIRYPFGKLDLVAVPDFAAGGMENTAAIFFRETDLLADERTASAATRENIASIVAHEVAHQWFGDLVTMQWWDDLWLNEGFATWMSSHPLEAWKPQWNVAVDEASENQEALNLDSLKSTHAIHAAVESPADIEGSFDAIAYEKGAAIVRMIEGYVGAEAFRDGINAYLQAHAYGNATSQDFWTAIASTSHRPVDRILPTFVNQAGVPLIEVSLRCEDNSTMTRGTFRQQRFTLEPGSNGAAPGTVWQVPICTKIQGSSSPGSCPVLDRERQVVEIAHGCPSWVFINAGAHGYYRTAYPPELLRAMAPEIETALTAPERLTLVEDEWALVRAGRHTAGDYLTIASGFGREPMSGVLTPVASKLEFIDQYLTTDEARPKLQSFVRSLFRRALDALGIEKADGDSDDRRALRGVLISALGTTGADADVVAASRAAVDRAIGGGAPLDTAAASALIEVAAQHGDAKLYDAIAAAAERAASPQNHYRYINALPSFRDPGLIERALQEARSSRMRTQDTARYLAQFFGNPAARDRAWEFLKQNWTDLEPKLRIAFGDAGLARSLGAFCDAHTRDDIRTFFAAHSLPSATRALEATFDRIDNCIELRERQTSLVTGWLNR
jgi:aminopeptidase N